MVFSQLCVVPRYGKLQHERYDRGEEFVLWYCVVATRALLGKNCIQNEYFCDF